MPFEIEGPSAQSWFNIAFGSTVGLLTLLWKVVRGDIKDLQKAQDSFVKSDTVAQIETTQREMIGMQGRFVTHDQLRQELEGRFNEMDTRRLQMHNHTMDTVNQLIRSVEGLRSDMREDMRGVHERIDGALRQRRREDTL